MPELERVVTVTTRAPRTDEVDGKHYIFMNRRRFDEMKRRGGFFETAQVHGASYGTPKELVSRRIKEGKSLILAIDVQGARQIKTKMREAVLIFITPPSLGELRRRLTSRSTEDAAAIERRLEAAADEIGHMDAYDYVVVNQDVVQAAERLKGIIRGVS